MIFVTVGTHEQPFDRLVRAMDALKSRQLQEEVLIQTGFSRYEPKFCQWSKMLPFEVMWEKVKQARIVITHGGPASFMMPLQIGKVPVVVPRRAEFGEHVNNHQVEFVRQAAGTVGMIPVMEVEDLGKTLADYDILAAGVRKTGGGNNARFNAELARLIDDLL